MGCTRTTSRATLGRSAQGLQREWRAVRVCSDRAWNLKNLGPEFTHFASWAQRAQQFCTTVQIEDPAGLVLQVPNRLGFTTGPQIG